MLLELLILHAPVQEGTASKAREGGDASCFRAGVQPADRAAARRSTELPDASSSRHIRVRAPAGSGAGRNSLAPGEPERFDAATGMPPDSDRSQMASREHAQLRPMAPSFEAAFAPASIEAALATMDSPRSDGSDNAAWLQSVLPAQERGSIDATARPKGQRLSAHASAATYEAHAHRSARDPATSHVAACRGAEASLNEDAHRSAELRTADTAILRAVDATVSSAAHLAAKQRTGERALLSAEQLSARSSLASKSAADLRADAAPFTTQVRLAL